MVEFELTHLVNHHVVLVQTDIRTRKARVIERYSKSGRTMSENDIDIMFSKQSNTQEKQRELEKKIQENRNGSSLVFNNSENTPDIRKVFFSVLNSVDISGELRTRFILKKLGFSDMESIAFYAELKKIHEELHRFYHTWEHIIELLTYLFDYAIQEDLTDD